MELLLAALPEIARESCFALHGGTAINMFVRNMPRLSVDIDLAYLPLVSIVKIGLASKSISRVGVNTIP